MQLAILYSSVQESWNEQELQLIFNSKVAHGLKPHPCLLPGSRSSRCLMLLCS